MPFANYNDLQDAVASWLARDDLSVEIIDFIRLAEVRIQQELKLTYVDATTTGNFVADQNYIDIPADCLEVRTVTVDSSPPVVISIVTKELLPTIRNNESGNTPYAGCQHGRKFELAPVPGDTTAYTMDYHGSITALTTGAPTSWLLTTHPNLYLYGALLEAEPFLANDPRMQTWERQFEKAAAALRRQEWRSRTGGGALIVRPDVVA